MARKKRAKPGAWEAGWYQRKGREWLLVPISRHKSLELAKGAARRLARMAGRNADGSGNTSCAWSAWYRRAGKAEVEVTVRP